MVAATSLSLVSPKGSFSLKWRARCRCERKKKEKRHADGAFSHIALGSAVSNPQKTLRNCSYFQTLERQGARGRQRCSVSQLVHKGRREGSACPCGVGDVWLFESGETPRGFATPWSSSEEPRSVTQWVCLITSIYRTSATRDGSNPGQNPGPNNHT